MFLVATGMALDVLGGQLGVDGDDFFSMIRSYTSASSLVGCSLLTEKSFLCPAEIS